MTTVSPMIDRTTRRATNRALLACVVVGASLLSSVFAAPAHAAGVVDRTLLSFTGAAVPGSKVALVIGTNEGLADEETLRYAETDAEKVRRSLVDLGEFESSDVIVLRGATAADVRAMLARLARDATAPETFFFYYSGHGDDENLHLRGTRLPMAELRGLLTAVESSVQIVLVDACRSGGMVRAKGARLGPAFDINVRKTSEVKGRVLITSSSSNEVAQESDKLLGSFFTHYWVSGLYGRADANDDGLVTLEEAYRFAHYQTVTETQASSGGTQHPSFDVEVAGEGALVLANLRKKTSLLRIHAASAGSYLVFDDGNQLLLTELKIAGPGVAEFALPKGRYRITKREDARLLGLDVTIEENRASTVSDAEFDEVELDETGAKGAPLTLRERVGRTVAVDGHGPQVGVGIRGFLAEGLAPGLEIQTGYRLQWRYLLVEPRVAVRTTSTTNANPMVYVEADLGSLVAARVPVGPLAFFGGVDAGVAPFIQTSAPSLGFANPSGILPLTVQGRGVLGADLALFDGVAVGARAGLGGQVFTVRGMPVVFPTAGATLQAAFLF